MENEFRTGLSVKELVVLRDEPQKLSAAIYRRGGAVDIFNGQGIAVDHLQAAENSGGMLAFECSLWRILTMADEKTRFYLEGDQEHVFNETNAQEFAVAASPKNEFLLLKTDVSADTSERCFYIRLDGQTLIYLLELIDRARSVFTAPQKAVSITFGDYYPDMDDATGGNHGFGYARNGYWGETQTQQVGVYRTADAVPLLEYKRPLITDGDQKRRTLIASRRRLQIEAENNGFRFRVHGDVSQSISFKLIEQLWHEYKKTTPASEILKKAADENIFQIVAAIGRARKIAEGKRTRTIRLPERAVMRVKYSYSKHPITTKRKLNIEAKVFAGIEKNADQIHAYEFNFDQTGNQIINCRNPFRGFAAW